MSVDEDQVAFDRREEYSAKSDNKSAKCCNREKFLLAFERRLHRLSIREVEGEISKGLRVLRKHVERKRKRERERQRSEYKGSFAIAYTTFFHDGAPFRTSCLRSFTTFIRGDRSGSIVVESSLSFYRASCVRMENNCGVRTSNVLIVETSKE